MSFRPTLHWSSNALQIASGTDDGGVQKRNLGSWFRRIDEGERVRLVSAWVRVREKGDYRERRVA